MGNENLMKTIYHDRVYQDNLGKGLHDSIFGFTLIKDAVSKMIQLSHNGLTGTQGKKKMISVIIEEMIKDDSLEDIASCVVEYILSGLIINEDLLSGKEPKYRNIRMSTGNKIRKELLGLQDTEENNSVAVQLIELGLESLSEYIDTEYTNERHKKLRYKVKREFQDKIISDIRQKSESGFYALPTTEPPIDWDVFLDDENKVKLVGGYASLKSPIIRGGKIDMPLHSFDYNFLLYNQEPLKALNIIQSVPFRINKANIDRVNADLMDDPIKPEASSEVKLFKREQHDFFQKYPTREDREEVGVEIPDVPECVLKYDSNLAKYKTNVGKLISAGLALKIAHMFKDEDKIFFPHNFDYRGRIYPIPSTLTPQGDDIAKGLLEFAEPVQLTEDGVEACYAYLASVYGYDKSSYLERIELGYKLMDDPETDYHDAEEPYVFAQIFDLLKQVRATGDMTSRVALAIDGTCNGLQHMAAITMDGDGGDLVNVGGSKVRHDIYKEVANSAHGLMEDDIASGNYVGEELDQLILLSGIMNGDKARSIAKRPVMINPYGGTFIGYKGYILQALQEYYPDKSSNMNSVIITQYVNRAMNTKLIGGSMYQKWVRKTFSDIARLGVLPQFNTPDGFLVKNYSMEMNITQRSIPSLVSRNGSKTLRMAKRTDEINVRKIGVRAQPNIIHSLDANHLRSTAISLHEAGVSNLWFIHDSYASDPNSYKLLNEITRKEFVGMYSHDNERHPIKCIIDRLKSQLRKHDVEYKFAEFPTFKEGRLDLDSVLGNEYFFS